jgi:predicted RNA-binding protein with PUA-like domain
MGELITEPPFLIPYSIVAVSVGNPNFCLFQLKANAEIAETTKIAEKDEKIFLFLLCVLRGLCDLCVCLSFPSGTDHNTRMPKWLLKTEPDSYSFLDLQRDKKTVWDGVTNALALKHMRTMNKGDLALIYHTGHERAAVGIAQITSKPYPDPSEDDEKLVVVDLKAKKALKSPVALDVIKADKTFAGWDLLRIGRLSIVPVPQAMWMRFEELAEAEES